MMRFLSVSLLSTLCLINQPLAAMTIDYGTVFPTVVQGQTDNINSNCNSANASTLEITNSSRIKGGTSPSLNLCKINVQSNSGNCINSAGNVAFCTANGIQIPMLVLDPFMSSSITSSTTYNNNQVVTLGASGNTEYGNLMVDNAVLKFSNVNTTYKIKSLTVRNGQAALYLAPGDYWIDTLDLDGRPLILSDPGTTRIFVKNDLSVKNQATLNADSMGSLVIIGYNNIELLGGTHNGYFYANGNFIMRNQGTVNGRITARHIYIYDSYVNDDSTTPPPLLGCITDDFSQPPLSVNWAAAKSGGTFTPSIISGRLRLTEAVTSQATSITYQRLFPAASNLVTIEFDQAAYGGSAADGIAMVLSDATVTPQPGSSGGPLGYGYKTNAPGFAGGWLGVGIDEYGNFRAEGGANNQTSKANTVSIRGSGSAYSGYRYLFGTDTLSPTIHSGNSYPSPPHRYRLTVDSRTSGQALVTIQRNTGSGYVTLIPTFNAIVQTGQAALPANFYLSFTGSTGASTNIHELDNVRICSISSRPVGQQIDHFEFDHSGQGLTCNPEEMTIRACADASCSTLVTSSVTAVLSPSTLTDGGWVGGNSVTFTTGTTKVKLRKSTAGSTTIGVTSSTPSTKPLSKTLCRAGSGALSEASCTLTFADSGFVFDVPDKIANQPATGVVIKAVKKDDSTKQCVPGFASVSRTLNFWSSYISPSTTVNPANPTVTVNGTAVGASAAAPVSIPLAFDSAGQATLSSVNYVDAGQMQLDASYTGSTTNGDDGLVMTGSDQFISRPLGLCVQPETTCNAGNVSCPYFKRAGEPFTLTISGRAWEKTNDTDLCSGNITTPNFALAAIPLGSTLVAPTTGGAATVGTSSYSHQASSSGTQTVSQSVSEVGVFKFTATPPSYLGMTIPVASSLATGRFTPYNFAVSNGSVSAGCGSFSYMDQPMPTRFTVTARNLSGGTTSNYRDEFATATLGLVAENGDNGVPLSLRLSGLGSLGWQAGLFTANQHPETFARNTSPDGPFSQLALGLQLFDNESAIDLPLKDTNMNATTSGACGSNCTAVRLSTQDLRHGRLSVSSGRAAVGSALALPLMMESYTGSGWQRNVEDACTQLDLKVSGGFVFDRTYNATKAQLTLIDNSSTSLLALTTSRDMPTGQPTSATAQAGYIWLHFTAPGISDRVNYQLDLGKQPKQPTWLSYDWNGNGLVEVADMSGWAFFNQWRSSDRVIYRREVLN